jgi:hypothetical protein
MMGIVDAEEARGKPVRKFSRMITTKKLKKKLDHRFKASSS